VPSDFFLFDRRGNCEKMGRHGARPSLSRGDVRRRREAVNAASWAQVHFGVNGRVSWESAGTSISVPALLQIQREVPGISRLRQGFVEARRGDRFYG
jgi:hypothetical protein